MNPGTIVLLGSGETQPSSGKIHETVVGNLPERPRIVILETPAGFEPNSAAVAGRIKRFLERRLQNYGPQVEVLPARRRGTPFSPDNAEIVAPLLDADEILLGPGSPTYAVRQLRDSLALQMIGARQRLGATLFLSSAATLAFGRYTMPVYEIYKVGEDLHWKPGLDYFRHYGLTLSLIPHWNNRDGGEELDTSRCYVGRERFRRLVQMVPAAHTIVGIDEHTALILDFATGSCRVRGRGTVTLLHGEQTGEYGRGSSFSLDILGRWQIPEGGKGLAGPVWEQALQAAASKGTAQGAAQAAPPAAVRSLAATRAEARARRDWARADSLREQIAALGWQIVDTPEGSRLHPLDRSSHPAGGGDEA